MRTSILCIALAMGVPVGKAAITIQFDYTLDASSASPFFSLGSPARQSLEAAGNAIGSALNDSLTSISPSSGNTWLARFVNPTTGSVASALDMTVSANTVKVFVGARNLGATTLGEAGPGVALWAGSAEFGQTVDYRGQNATGATADAATSTDFGPWGGSIAFNNTGINWFYEATGNPSIKPASNQYDFYSVALHELGHVLGFGGSLSWDHYEATGPSRFTGPVSTSVHGGNVALDLVSPGHWQDGTVSTLPGTVLVREAAMDPSIANGQRKVFTALDWAGLKDVGWQVDGAQLNPVPEPAGLLAGSGLLLLSFGLWRRCAVRVSRRV